jgi:RNA polymerase sigma-70 factor, ECF subfamily
LSDVTRLLCEWRDGDAAALDELTARVYSELRRLAGHYLRNERAVHTLQPTAIINEAYLRLINQAQPDWKSRSHFFGVAAHLMRQILVDHARRSSAVKRGSGGQKVVLDEAVVGSAPERSVDMLALDQSLARLAELDERKARVVELRHFGGLTTEETAEVLGISTATVVRELRMAEAWLKRELS